MATKWTRLDDGEWAVRIEGSDFHPGQATGFLRVVTSRDGKKKAVVLGEFVRTFLVKGKAPRDRRVDIYRVDDEATADHNAKNDYGFDKPRRRR